MSNCDFDDILNKIISLCEESQHIVLHHIPSFPKFDCDIDHNPVCSSSSDDTNCNRGSECIDDKTFIAERKVAYEKYKAMCVDLTNKNKHLQEKKDKLLGKAISLFDRLCLSPSTSPEQKIILLENYLHFIPDKGLDMLIRYRDMLPHLKGCSQHKPVLDLLALVVKSTKISGYERFVTCVVLHNNFLLDVCYKLFCDLAFDETLERTYRVDACRYLYATEGKVNVTNAQEVLLDIIDTLIEDDPKDSEKRYAIISSFISRTGINTLFNTYKLKIPYNEKFLVGLQSAFFYNTKNGVRQRILSGQHLLQMNCVDADEKHDIIKILLDIGRSHEYDENTCADALDVVIRLGDEEDKITATSILRNMGFGLLGPNSQIKGTIMDRSHTIYNDSQNVHQFSQQTMHAIEKLVEECIIESKTYKEIYEEIILVVKKWATQPNGKVDNKLKFSAMKALNRVNQDTATFTKYNVTLIEIVVCIYTKIMSHPVETQLELKKRLCEELCDMGDTCSSGHADRFVNVLSGYDFNLSVSWEDQIKSNMAGRMNARIRDCDDPQIKDALGCASTEFATEEDKRIYADFIGKNLADLKEELEEEFVNTGYVSQEDFNKFFENGTVNWL